MATLKDSFVFSAQNLQAFADCARRFELRYVEGRLWPAVSSEPFLENEQRSANGRLFHEMVHRDILGLDVTYDGLDEDLERWWHQYQRARPAGVAGTRLAEQRLVGSIQGWPLVATFDLVALIPGERATIYDWKTSRRRTPRDQLQLRLQTRVYPYVLVQAGRWLTGEAPIDPNTVEMIYWFADHPGDPERFTYSDVIYASDEAYLGALVDQILAAASFDLTPFEKHCTFCAYRSLCGRGGAAGVLTGENLDIEDLVLEADDMTVDLDDIEAIEF